VSAREPQPVPFDEFMREALYGENGFYTRPDGGHAGRRGDFLTSPEVGPLFGAVIANYLDAEWARLGRPEQFTVVATMSPSKSLHHNGSVTPTV